MSNEFKAKKIYFSELYKDGVLVTLPAPTGPTGVTGSTGPTGAVGATGATGSSVSVTNLDGGNAFSTFGAGSLVFDGGGAT